MTERLTTVMPPSLCPQCGDKLDMATSTTEAARPEPGDFSICLHCGTILRFDADLRCQRASAADFDQAPKVILALINKLKFIREKVVSIDDFRSQERRH